MSDSENEPYFFEEEEEEEYEESEETIKYDNLIVEAQCSNSIDLDILVKNFKLDVEYSNSFNSEKGGFVIQDKQIILENIATLVYYASIKIHHHEINLYFYKFGNKINNFLIYFLYFLFI